MVKGTFHENNLTCPYCGRQYSTEEATKIFESQYKNTIEEISYLNCYKCGEEFEAKRFVWKFNYSSFQIDEEEK